MFRFANPEFLYSLVLIPLLIVFFVMVRRSKRRALERFGNLQLLQKLMVAYSPGRQNLKAALVIAAVTFFLIAMARPQIGTRLEEVKRKGVDIFVAIDVSASMLAQDIKPNRLEKAKHEIASLINQLKGDRIGLIVFAGEAFVQCPLTLDYGAAKMFLDVVDPDLIPVPGTAIGKAILKAVESFVAEERKHKVLILITDGEDTIGDPEPMKAAELAEKEGVVIYTVGIGTPEGVPIPVYDEAGRQVGFKKDRNGNVVTSKLDQLTLEKIALQTNGKYYHATPSEMELSKIYAEIQKMEKKELSSRIFSQYEDRYQYFLALGLVLLLIDTFLPERKKMKQEWRGRYV
jgi:Ca-activated chloride channel family protein